MKMHLFCLKCDFWLILMYDMATLAPNKGAEIMILTIVSILYRLEPLKLHILPVYLVIYLLYAI